MIRVTYLQTEVNVAVLNGKGKEIKAHSTITWKIPIHVLNTELRTQNTVIANRTVFDI